MKRQLISVLLSAALCTGAAPAALAAQADPAPVSTGTAADPAANRRADLDTLMTTLEGVHPNLYANAGKEAFEAKRAEIETGLDGMSDFDFAIAVSELVALVGDSHTGANIGSYVDQLHFLPLSVAWMDGSWVVTQIDAAHGDCLGGYLTGINGVPLVTAQERISPMIGADNAVYARRQFGGLLYVYEILEHYGIADNPDAITLTIRVGEAPSRNVTVAAATAADTQKVKTVSLKDQRKAVPPTEPDKSKNYFYKALDSRTLYIQYNACMEDEALPMETFTTQVEEAIDQNGYDRVIVDLRNNGGGSDGVLIPLMYALEERHEQDGMAFYTLIGDGTFSSALINAVELKEAGATLVGTPTGGSVDHFGSVSSFELPHSKIRITHSNKFIDLGTLLKAAEPYQIESFQPDITAAQTRDDYLAGKDTAVEAILARTDDAGQPKTELTRAALAAHLARAWSKTTGSALALEQPTFSDVSLFSYAAPYAIWAKEKGVLIGDSDAIFAPDRTVTYEELAVVLQRYAALFEKTVTANAAADAAGVSPWATDAVKSLAHVLTPDGAFQPQASVTRAEFESIFTRFQEAIA